jgi:hypothetical protein
MNKQTLLFLLPIVALGACTQPQAPQDKDQGSDWTVPAVEEAVNQTVVLAITGVR